MYEHKDLLAKSKVAFMDDMGVDELRQTFLECIGCLPPLLHRPVRVELCSSPSPSSQLVPERKTKKKGEK